MGRVLAPVYGLICYAIFFLTFLWSIAFVENFAIPASSLGGLIAVTKTIDSGVQGDLIPTLLIDALLLGVFAIQHSVMARPGFKKVWTRIVPEPIERSTYVLLASLALLLVNWQWRPLTSVVWETHGTLAQVLLWASLAGFGIVLIATFLLSHFHLFGLSQVVGHATGKPAEAAKFQTPLFYKVVRHPIYFGFLVAFWAAPKMTLGHLYFAAGATGYIIVGTLLEERDLIAHFGDTYRDYKRRVSMFIPWFPKKA